MGKGSARRPMQISRDEYDARWAGIDWARKGEKDYIAVVEIRVGKEGKLEVLSPVSEGVSKIVEEHNETMARIAQGLGIPKEHLGEDR